MIERQENCQIVSEIVISLLNGCRDSDARAKLLLGSCLGEIGAIDPAYIMATNGLTSLSSSSFLHSSSSSNSFATSAAASYLTTTSTMSTTSNTSVNANIKKGARTPQLGAVQQVRHFINIKHSMPFLVWKQFIAIN